MNERCTNCYNLIQNSRVLYQNGNRKPKNVVILLILKIHNIPDYQSLRCTTSKELYFVKFRIQEKIPGILLVNLRKWHEY